MRKPPANARHHGIEFSEDLISRCIVGEKDALEDLAVACLPKVWKTVYLTCGGGPDVDDIAQNALIDAFSGIGTCRGTGSFSAWLGRITVRAIYRHSRKRAIWSLIPSPELLESEPAPKKTWPDHRAENRRIFEALAGHLSNINLKNRIALVLSVVHGYSVAEIAMAEGCNIEAAKKRLQRGRLELGARLKKDPFLREILREAGL